VLYIVLVECSMECFMECSSECSMECNLGADVVRAIPTISLNIICFYINCL